MCPGGGAALVGVSCVRTRRVCCAADACGSVHHADLAKRINVLLLLHQ